MSTKHNLFEEKGEPKRYRTEVLPLTSLTPYQPAHNTRSVLLSADFSHHARSKALGREDNGRVTTLPAAFDPLSNDTRASDA